MERVVRLYQLWSWLPHFRVVAETEHLPTASEALGLSPSALSRALKQLESEVGRDLFLRDGRTIQLNSHGNELLVAVRQAMRGIDDALISLTEGEIPISLKIAAPGPFHSFLLLELTKTLSDKFPRLDIELCSCPTSEITNSLCRGTLDAVLHEGAVAHKELESIALTSMPKVVACSTEHPLATSSIVTPEELRQYPFAAPPPNEFGVRDDGWPVAEQRNVRLTLGSMQTGIDACLKEEFLVVLPRVIVELSGLKEVKIKDWHSSEPILYVTKRKATPLEPIEMKSFCDQLVGLFHQS